MPATTTAITGCDAVIRLEDSLGNERNISGSSNSADMELTNEIGEFKAFGTAWKKRYACGKDASLTLRVVYSTANDEGLDLLRNWYYYNSESARTMQINLPDGSIGSDRYEGRYLIQSLSIPLRSDDANPIMVDAQLVPDGEVTYSTIAT